MDKRAKAGYMMTLGDALAFWTRKKEAEEALGSTLTREESERLLVSMQIAEELSLEDLLDAIKGKKVVMVKGNKKDMMKGKNNEGV